MHFGATVTFDCVARGSVFGREAQKAPNLCSNQDGHISSNSTTYAQPWVVNAKQHILT